MVAQPVTVGLRWQQEATPYGPEFSDTVPTGFIAVETLPGRLDVEDAASCVGQNYRAEPQRILFVTNPSSATPRLCASNLMSFSCRADACTHQIGVSLSQMKFVLMQVPSFTSLL